MSWLPSEPTIAAVIPHFGGSERSNAWLDACLRSLEAQTLRLAATIVVDDVSPCPPDAVVRRFPEVSLFRNAENTGPFAIVDFFFRHLDADAILLHDSDDFSAPERLERLLAAVRRTGAEIVGCRMRTKVEDAGVPPHADLELPEDPRALFLEKPGAHPVILPSSLVRVAMVRRLGGFATGLRFGADTEFVRRAILSAKATNVAERLYVRRVHFDSLTRRPDTGIGTPARLEVQRELTERANEMVAAWHRGATPDLAPISRRDGSVELEHVLGPRPFFLRPQLSDGQRFSGTA